jgi:hypothetical protein
MNPAFTMSKFTNISPYPIDISCKNPHNSLISTRKVSPTNNRNLKSCPTVISWDTPYLLSDLFFWAVVYADPGGSVFFVSAFALCLFDLLPVGIGLAAVGCG